MKNKPFIQVQKVRKTFGQKEAAFDVLDEITFQINRGEFVSLIGPSGCGKSTLLNLVAGIIPCDHGSIWVDGQLVTKPGKDRGMVFQNHALFPWMTVWENLMFALDSTMREKHRAEREKVALHYLRLVGLIGVKDKKPSELSGGMKQRVGLARALAINPKVLLLDEPFGALDALTRSQLQDELARICEQEQKTVLMVTHDIEEAIMLSDRIMVMSPGPKARIVKSFAVHLSRPRDREELLDHATFVTLKKELVATLSQPAMTG